MERLILAVALVLGALIPQSAQAADPPVILLHGCCVPSTWAQIAMKPMADKLKAEGYAVHNLRLPSSSDARANAVYLQRYIDSRKMTKVHLVGHSLGGVSARDYVKNLGGGAKVVSLTLIDSPNDGGDTSCRLNKNNCAGSAYMLALNAGDDTPGDTRYTQINLTEEYVLDGGACFLQLDSGSHNSLPSHPSVQSATLATIRGGCPGDWVP